MLTWTCRDSTRKFKMETTNGQALRLFYGTYLLILLPSLCENMPSWNTADCPVSCSCVYEDFPYVVADRSLRTIDCSRAEVSRVPRNVPGPTQALVLRGGKLSIGALGQIPGNLTLLDVSHCQLYTLDYGWPIMPFMRYLNLEHNDLDYLANRTFQSMSGLLGLYLSHNIIEIFHSDGLVGLFRLRILDLSHNRLFTLDTRWFRDLRPLKVICLFSRPPTQRKICRIHFVYGTWKKNLISWRTPSSLESKSLPDVVGIAFSSLHGLLLFGQQKRILQHWCTLVSVVQCIFLGTRRRSA